MTWTTSQKIMFGMLVFLCVNYIFQLALDKTTEFQTSPLQEGFEDGGATALPKPTTGTESDTSVYTWTTDSQLIYDEFYSGVYDQLSNQADRTGSIGHWFGWTARWMIVCNAKQHFPPWKVCFCASLRKKFSISRLNRLEGWVGFQSLPLLFEFIVYHIMNLVEPFCKLCLFGWNRKFAIIFS